MRRAVPLSAAAMAAVVGVLVPAGPAAAEGQLTPGATQVLPLVLDTSGWDEVPEGLQVAVADLAQQENGCLELDGRPEDDTCDPDQGDLAQQLAGTVAAGRLDDGRCLGLGDGVPLVLTSAGAVTLPVDDDRSWADVDCLRVSLTFVDGADNNRAQSDSLSFTLAVTAWSDAPPPAPVGAGDPQPGGTGAVGTAGSPAPDAGAPAGGPAGAPVGGPAGDPAARGGAVTAGARAAGGVAGPAAAGAPAGAPAGGAPSAGGAAEVVGRSDASVVVDASGVSVQTQTRAAGQTLAGTALAWGGAFLGAVALSWSLVLLVRRRRTERAA